MKANQFSSMIAWCEPQEQAVQNALGGFDTAQAKGGSHEDYGHQ